MFAVRATGGWSWRILADDDGVFCADITGDQASDRAPCLDELLEALPPDVDVNFDVKTSMEDATCEHTGTTSAQLSPVVVREAAAGQR
jgi:glycerophosphoryl diester phosphodiesterase